LTGTQVFLLVVSETGLVYIFTSPKFQPVVAKPEGKRLIQECLDAAVLSRLANISKCIKFLIIKRILQN
jgi:hypothetical protein